MGIKKNWSHMGTVSVFTLKRTDTTLDLSQKAKRAGEERKEKVGEVVGEGYLYSSRGIFGRQFWPLANRGWALEGEPLCTNNRSAAPCVQELYLYALHLTPLYMLETRCLGILNFDF